MKISYSAPAKVILSGEHAVVFSKPAIISAIDLRLVFNLWEEKKVIKSPTIHFIADATKKYLNTKKILFKETNFGYSIDSQIPIGRGLGSSAALSVAAGAAFLKFYTGKQFDKDTINNLAYKIEKRFHANTSGVDPSTVCFGGLIYYRKEFEFLKTISSLTFKIPKKIEENLYLIDTGKPKETTGEMVKMVGKNYNNKPQFIEEILNDIEKTTKRMVISLIKEDIDFFLKSLIDNQILLDMLGVVSQSAKKILKQLEPYGIGKITGAGGYTYGSGFILFYSDNQSGLTRFCQKNKLPLLKFKQSNEGVKSEL